MLGHARRNYAAHAGIRAESAAPAEEPVDSVVSTPEAVLGAHGPDHDGNVRGVVIDRKTGEFSVTTLNANTGDMRVTEGVAHAIDPRSVPQGRPYNPKLTL